MIRVGTYVKTVDWSDGAAVYHYGKVTEIQKSGPYKNWATVKYDELRVSRIVPIDRLMRAYK